MLIGTNEQSLENELHYLQMQHSLHITLIQNGEIGLGPRMQKVMFLNHPFL